MPNPTRILLLADTHLGIPPRRRADDFLKNYLAALEPAFRGEVDIVVHSGDVFDHPNVEPAQAYAALQPLQRIAESGIPVVIVPGNHERSQLQHSRFATHPRIHVFDKPRTFTIEIRGHRIAFAGFPFERKVRMRFRQLLAETSWENADADDKILCLHQCVEGAKVGPADFTFTTAPDVIRASDIPRELTAVLSGHIHRHQVLPLNAPFIYPGSTERTAFAEMRETKGYMILQLPGLTYEFRELDARPMRFERFAADGMSAGEVDRRIRAIVETTPADALLRLRLTGAIQEDVKPVLRAAHMRTFAPATLHLEIRTDAAEDFRAAQWEKRRIQEAPPITQLDLL